MFPDRPWYPPFWGVSASGRTGGQRKATASFTHTLGLHVDDQMRAILDEGCTAARHLYNVVLEQAPHRARRRRESRRCHKDRKTRDPERRTAGPRSARSATPSWRQHLDVCTARDSAKRAYDAVNDWRVGHRGRPRFKSARRGLQSLASTQHSGILVRGPAEDGVEIDLTQLGCPAS